MRIISILCVMIVLALNLMPCADEHDQVAHEPVRIASANHSHELPVDDACTPFCHCSCCASTVIVKYTSAPAQLIHVYQNTAFIPYTEHNYLDISQPIWQPPKIA